MKQWTLANEYPATSLPGEGDAHFARLVAQKTAGALSILNAPEAARGYTSRAQLHAVASGDIAMADSFGGALGEEEPIFGLASLPFVVDGIAAARSLHAAARPLYESAFARHNQALLFSTPWPPSGLWTRKAIGDAAGVKSLAIRAYDVTSRAVFERLGARASVVSFADVPAKLASGDIDAVLSSGDGGAGPKLWEYLPHFTAIDYAIPLSFATLNLDHWGALDATTRNAVQQAAAETEARQWKALTGRLAENYARMREHGVTIAANISRELRASLIGAASAAVEAWCAKAGPAARALVEAR